VAIFTDNFNRANEVLETSTKWTRVGGSAGAVTVDSNAVAIAIATETAYYSPDSSLTDHYAQGIRPAASLADSGFPVCVRLTDLSNFIGVRNSTGIGAELYKRVAGTFTQLGTTYNYTHAANDIWRLEVTGDVITFYLNGVARITATDAFNNTETKTGMIGRFNTSTNWLDAWEATSAVGSVFITSFDTSARRGQTNYNLDILGGSATQGAATVDINGSDCPIISYPAGGTGTIVCTIPTALAELYDATAVLTYTDNNTNTDTASVNFLPAATDSYVVTALPLDLTVNSFFYNYSGAAPTAGMNITGATLTSVTGKTVTYNTDGTWGLSAPVTVDETITVFFTSTDGTVSTVMVYTFYVGGGGGFSALPNNRRTSTSLSLMRR